MAGFIRVSTTESGDVAIKAEDFERLVSQHDLYRSGLGRIVNARTVANARYLAATTLAGMVPSEDIEELQEGV